VYAQSPEREGGLVVKKKRPIRRKKKHVRPKLDFFETPAWCVHALLRGVSIGGGTILDAGAGRGAITRVLRGLENPQRSKLTVVTGIEINPALAAEARDEGLPVATGDFLQILKQPLLPAFDPVDVVIGNPPFRFAEDFVLAAMRRACRVIFLLPLGFLASQGRAAFLRQNMPDVYILSKRPSFTKNGRHDRIDYAWFDWGANQAAAGPVRTHGFVSVLDLDGLAIE
jgi:hypothetical protein